MSAAPSLEERVERSIAKALAWLPLDERRALGLDPAVEERIRAEQAALRAAPSSVHTPGITRQAHGTVDETEEGPRAVWLRELEEHTSTHRETRARGYADAARRRRTASRLAGKTERDAKRDALWHFSRAAGQRERFDRVRDCGTESVRAMHVLCTGCGVTAERPLTCGHGIACVACRARKIRKRRGRLARARAVALQLAAKRGLLLPKRRGGRHSEKLLTLTAPHLSEHGVDERVNLMFCAWPHFLKAMNASLRERGEPAEWFRNAEWTLGEDEHGHPHFHVWFLGPFMPHAELVDWWREALARAGFAAERGELAQLEALEALVIDVRAVRNGRVDDAGVVTEVIKYVTKDIVARGEYVDAATYARVYEALDGRRVEQASKGFVALGAKEVCCPDCEARASFLVRVGEGPWRGGIAAQRVHAEKTTGPPSRRAASPRAGDEQR